MTPKNRQISRTRYNIVMPELPEVQTVVTQLANVITGATISRVKLHRPDFIRTGSRGFVRSLTSKRIESIERQAKRIICILSSGDRLAMHLGMSGRLVLESSKLPLLKHTHLCVEFERLSVEMRFIDPRRFGGVWLFTNKENGKAQQLSKLGPDALNIRVPQLRQILQRSRQIKALLLDQQIIGGLGNIYADESLFRAGIHPLSTASSLREPQVRALACSIRKTLKDSIDSGGSTLSDYRRPDGREGEFQKSHRVYGREGQPCTRCGAEILRIIAAGRSTHFCPSCQPE